MTFINYSEPRLDTIIRDPGMGDARQHFRIDSEMSHFIER